MIDQDDWTLLQQHAVVNAIKKLHGYVININIANKQSVSQMLQVNVYDCTVYHDNAEWNVEVVSASFNNGIVTLVWEFE